jgi:predicted amidophosphoribosyltransferase
MRCAACGHDNREEARFCLECGQPFGLRCSRCGAELPTAAKFCDRCAAPVAEPSAKVHASTTAVRPKVQRITITTLQPAKTIRGQEVTP